MELMPAQAGRGLRGLIGCIPPRRIAARSVARGAAEELRSELGRAVRLFSEDDFLARPETPIGN